MWTRDVKIAKRVDFSEIVCVQAMSDNSIVACEKQNDYSKLTKYSELGTVLKTTPLEELIEDIAEVTVDGNECIALAY